MTSTTINWISISGRLLGSLFYYAPDEEKVRSVLDYFQQNNWQAEWLGLKNPEKITALLNNTAHLSVQYQTMFIGPNALPAPPWGSVYLDKESVIFGDSLLKLRDFLRHHQIEFVRLQDEPEDHIGLMLMLAAYLAESRPELLIEFLRDHFLIWSSRYLALLSAQQDAPFYQGLALLTQETLDYWQTCLAIEIPKVQFYR
ncbi:Tat proofreading chaperone DmsD [Conservatibacter flavescens]|uniref:Probable Tat proofreading chaperone DmsD n=1 Tax=Conservatibacter flavescens TaxID=28161 RepID=A0A2M8RZS1_9PAST|nr:Tat proofreading chaperone DmsD [Conservatibacter flavescens]PJG84387.1 Tat proofreading chaperone DmsD [Conservatibacter flavescens]